MPPESSQASSDTRAAVRPIASPLSPEGPPPTLAPSFVLCCPVTCQTGLPAPYFSSQAPFKPLQRLCDDQCEGGQGPRDGRIAACHDERRGGARDHSCPDHEGPGRRVDVCREGMQPAGNAEVRELRGAGLLWYVATEGPAWEGESEAARDRALFPRRLFQARRVRSSTGASRATSPGARRCDGRTPSWTSCPLSRRR